MEPRASLDPNWAFRSSPPPITIRNPAAPTPYLPLAQYRIGGRLDILGRDCLQPRHIIEAFKKDLMVNIGPDDMERLFFKRPPKPNPICYEVGCVSFPRKKAGSELRRDVEAILQAHPDGKDWRIGGIGACIGFVQSCWHVTLRGDVVALGPKGQDRGRILVVRNCNGQPEGRKLQVEKMERLKPSTVYTGPIHVLVARQIAT
jgi:hypothetical protein